MICSLSKLPFQFSNCRQLCYNFVKILHLWFYINSNFYFFLFSWTLRRHKIGDKDAQKRAAGQSDKEPEEHLLILLLGDDELVQDAQGQVGK